MQKIFVWLCAVVFAIGVLVSRATPAVAQESCRPDLFGQLCTSTSIANPTTVYTQYGYVEVQSVPPESIARDIRTRLRNSPDQRIKRLFRREAKGGVVTVKIELMNGGAARDIGLVPIISFTTDDATGVRVTSQATNTAGNEYFRMTPYFRINQNQFSVRTTISVRSTENANSKINNFVRGAVRLAAPFVGVPGWLLSAATSEAVGAKVGEIEDKLFGADDIVETTQPMLLAFTSANTLEYRYSLNPNNLAPTGVIRVRVRSTPSLFTQTLLGNGLPNYGASAGIAPRARDLLSWEMQSDKTLGVMMTEIAGQNTISAFNQGATPADSFDTACTSVKEAANNSQLGLTANDASALFWAAFVSSANATRAEVRSKPCLIPEMGQGAGSTFAQYALYTPTVVPPPPPPPPPPGEGRNRSGGGGGGTEDDGARPETQGKPAKSPSFTTSELRAFMDDQVFVALSASYTPAAARARRNLLNSLFSDQVTATAEWQDVPEFDVFTGGQIERQLVATALTSLPAAGGCLLRAPDGKVSFFARRSADKGSGAGALWHITISLLSDRDNPDSDSVRIDSIALRAPVATDFTERRRQMPNTPRCHAEATAPGGVTQPSAVLRPWHAR